MGPKHKWRIPIAAVAMSTLTLQTFLGNSNIQELQDFATVLLSRMEKEYPGDSVETEKVKSLFIDVYQIIKPGLKSSPGEGSGTTAPKISQGEDRFKSLSQAEEQDFTLSATGVDVLNCAILQIRDNLWLESEDSNIRMLSEIMVLNILVTLMLEISKTLITSTLNTSNTINYYDCVLSKKYSVLLYFLQTLPQNTFAFLMEVKKVKLVSPSSTIVEIPSWIPNFFRDIYAATLKYFRLAYTMIDRSIEDFFRSPTTFLMERQQNSRSLFVKFWNSTFQLPYYYSKYEIERRRKNLVNLQKTNISKLGYLLTNSPHYDLKNDNLSTDFSTINSFLESFLSSDKFTQSSLPKEKQLNIDNLYSAFSTGSYELKHKLDRVESENAMPSYFTRNWPIIIPAGLFIGSYVPSALRNTRLLITDPQVRSESYEYFKQLVDYCIDTTVSFWKHWVVNPINNILKTIRHDDNSEIALMSQKSLASDLDSLERMAIDYIVDSSPTGGNMSLSELDQIKNAIKSGDMTLVMNNYERDLKTPIKSIVAGDMIRNILIQIQKTKVDGSLALNGVDQILKSQELVFGFVAASPSLFIVWMLKNSFMSWYNGESKSSYKNVQTREVKTRVNASLGKIEKLVDYMVSQKRDNSVSDDVDYYKNGLVFIEVRSLKRLSKKLLPLYVYYQFKEDVEELVGTSSDVEYKLLTIQRIWNVYAGYLR